MEKALNFLLQNWLIIGLEVLVFFSIGLILSKLIWGRYHRRLFAAIDENMNLAGQWQALGGAQRDLFKKLRSRWQEDRDSWESQLEEFSKRLKIKTERVVELEKAVKNASAVSEEEEPSKELLAAQERVAEMELTLSKKEEEIEGLNHSLELRAETDEVRSLRARVSDLEQDLINAHDELHGLRSRKGQADDVAPVPARTLSEAGTTEKADRKILQLEVLLKQRSRELMSLRNTGAVSTAGSDDAVSSDEAQDWKAIADQLQESLDEQIDEHAEAVQGLYAQIANLENELQTKEDLLADGVESGTIGTLLAQSNAGENDVPAMPTPLFAKVEETEVNPDDEKEKLIASLQSELSDALEEMKDVRKGYNSQFVKVELLQARIADEESRKKEEAFSPEDFAKAQKEVEELTAKLKDSTDELADVRRGYNENRLEHNHLKNQIEELEAIVDDRNDEVETVTSELESQRDLIRSLRVKVAQQEGDLEGLNEQNHQMIKDLAEKTSVAEFLTARIAEVELALGERYGEMNRISSELDIAKGTLNNKASYSEEISRELSELKWDNGLMEKQIVELESNLAKATAELEVLTPEIKERRQKALVLEDRYNLKKTEASEIAEALQLAQSELASAREQLILSGESGEEMRSRLERLEAENQTLVSDLTAMRTHIETCEDTITEREKTISSMKGTIEEIESDREQLQSRLSELENSRDSIESNRAELADALETKKAQLGDFSERINRLVHGGYQNLSSGDDDGGASVSVSNLYSSDDEQINALAGAISLLESRALDAEQNFGSCEKELVVLREEIIELKQNHRIEMGTRISELETIQAELDEARSEIETLRADLETASAELEQSREGAKATNEEAERTREDFKTASAELEQTRDEFEALRAELEQFRGDLESTRTELEQSREEFDGAQAELGQSREEFETLSAELEQSRGDLESTRAELEEARANLNEAGSSVESEIAEHRETSSHLKELVESLRNELSSKQLVIRELEDQLAYERDREVFRDQEVSDPVPVEELNRVEAVSGNRIEESGEGNLSLYFKEGTASLNAEAMDRIDSAAREIRSLGGRIKLKVVGYAGSEGSAAMNESLSARRADAVRERLMENGIQQPLIIVQSAGEDDSLSLSGPEHSWKARRVEITLVPEPIAESIN